MISHQLLIGGVATGLGLLALAVSLSNYDGFFQLAKLRLLESTLGRSRARLVCAALGCVLIALGGLILAGILPWQS